MESSTDGINLGFATMYLAGFPPRPTRVVPAGVTIEVAVRGTLRLLDRELHPDDVVVHRGGDLVAAPSRAGSAMLAIGVDESAPIAQRFAGRIAEVEVVRIPSLARHRVDLTGELAAKDSQRTMAIGGVVMNLLADCLRRLKTSTASPVRAALELLDREFQSSISLGDIARRVGMRPSTLASRFQREVGMTVGAYTRRKRVELAHTLLVESDMPVAEIARTVGFYDESHLDRCFRQISGRTPGAARRAARERR